MTTVVEPPQGVLSDAHRRMLTVESGLTPETIAARGYRTVSGDAGVQELQSLGFNMAQARTAERGDVLLVPMYDMHGNVISYQIRPDSPRKRNEKHLKYETPAQGVNRLDVPPGGREAVASAVGPVWVTEGAKTADAIAQTGAATLMLAGVWGFMGRQALGQGTAVIADLFTVPLAGRMVYLAYDSDVVTKQPVQDAEQALARQLNGRNAAVRVVRIPPAPDGGKQGADDYLAAGGTLDALIATAAEPSTDPLGGVSPQEYAYRLAQQGRELGLDAAGSFLVRPVDAEGAAGPARRRSVDETRAEIHAQMCAIAPSVSLSVATHAERRLFGERVGLRVPLAPERLVVTQDATWLDMGTDCGHDVVTVNAHGWGYARWHEVPHWVVRGHDVRELPIPVPPEARTWAPLWELLGLDEDVAALVRTWLVAVLTADRVPLLWWRGAAGSGKSALARLVGGLVGMPKLAAAPRDLQEAVTRLTASPWLMVENLGSLDPATSDRWCTAITDGHIAYRPLHTNSQTWLSGRWTGQVTSVTDVPGALDDLMSRALVVDVSAPPVLRAPEELDASFAAIAPAVLGALLDDAVAVRARLAAGTLGGGGSYRFPRLTGIAALLDERSGATVHSAALTEHATVGVDDRAETDPWVSWLVSEVVTRGGRWVAPAEEIFDAQREHRKLVTTWQTDDLESWAKNATQTARWLASKAGRLRAHDVRWRRLPRQNQRRPHLLEMPEGPVTVRGDGTHPPTVTAETAGQVVFGAGSAVDSRSTVTDETAGQVVFGDGSDGSVVDQRPTVTDKTAGQVVFGDGSDGSDGSSQVMRGGGNEEGSTCARVTRTHAYRGIEPEKPSLPSLPSSPQVSTGDSRGDGPVTTVTTVTADMIDIEGFGDSCSVWRIDRGQTVQASTPAEAGAALATVITTTGHVTVDVETSGYPVGHADHQLRTVQLGGPEAAWVFDVRARDPEVCRVVRTALAAAPVLHAHSATADLVPLAHAGLVGDIEDAWARMYDTVIPAKLADPQSTGSDPGLKQLAGTLLGAAATAPAAEEARAALFKTNKWVTNTRSTTAVARSGWAQVDPADEVMLRYAASDVLDTAALAIALPVIPQGLLDRERLAQRMTARVAHRGVRIDADHVATLTERHGAARDDAAARAVAIAAQDPATEGFEKSASAVQVAAVCEHFGAELPRTPAGNPSVAESVLESLRGAEGPLGAFVAAVLDYRHNAKVVNGFLEPYRQLCERGDGRARPTCYTLGTDTGRMSMVRPNLQQLPRKGGVRACITADPGQLMIGADFSGVEIRVAAALSQDPTLLRLLAEGRDLHAEIARIVFGENATKAHRYTAKRIVFGRLYGGGITTLAAQSGCSLETAQRAVDTLDALTPQLSAWSARIRDAVKAGHTQFPSYSGRVIHLPREYPHKGPNYCIQGSARELLVDALARWNRTKWGNATLLPVHDELDVFVPEADAEEATAALVDCMRCDLYGVSIVAEPSTPSFAWADST